MSLLRWGPDSIWWVIGATDGLIIRNKNPQGEGISTEQVVLLRDALSSYLSDTDYLEELGDPIDAAKLVESR